MNGYSRIPVFSGDASVARVTEHGECQGNLLPQQECWNRLHTEFRDRTHVDLKARAKNHKPKLSGVEYAVKYGYVEQLYAIAQVLFGA